MKPKTLILTVVAVTCGLGASYMTSQLLASREPEPVETFNFLVAKRNLNMGDPIKNPGDMFEFKSFTKDTQPREGIDKLEDLKGRILKIPRRAGDPIHNEDLYSANDPAYTFTSSLPTGYRAVALRVNLESAAAGWATLPMSRVDIINTVRRGDDKSSYSHFLLENVLVLAIDGTSTRDEGGRAMAGNIVTFALSPDDCLRLNLARDTGTLTLALRKTNDTQAIGNVEVRADELRNRKGHQNGTDDAPTEGGYSPGVGATPQQLANLPTLDAVNAQPAVEATKIEAPKAPEFLNHGITIIEGGNSRIVSYQLDPKTLRAVNGTTDVTRTELPKAE